MITPDFSGFKRLIRRGNLIAVRQEIPADLETPVSCFLKLADREPEAFLLESAEQEERIGRYSFIGICPAKILTADGTNVTIEEKGRKKTLVPKTHLTEVIEGLMASSKLANPEALPNFAGGFVGYLSYENVIFFEDVKIQRKAKQDLPDGVFFECREMLIFDHFRKTLSVVVLARADSVSHARKIYNRSTAKIRHLMRRLQQPLRIRRAPKPSGATIHSNMKPSDFCRKVQRIREYIRAGDCIQVVFSQRFSFPSLPDPFRIYRALRSVNPSPYMFYFRSKDVCLIGSSPEVLVRKNGRKAEVRPIAGTRPRGRDSNQDLLLEENLKKSPKEMAEHLMLVDLGRNDLGRVCQFNTIRVANFARVERYSHVMHLVSDVIGRLKPGQNSFDLLKATFPAGTVSGAPKIRAMEIINELEPTDRGPYAGCLGYFSFNGDMDMCITIRTLVVRKNRIDLQAGAGIVKDSSPVREYQETFNKARALLKAVQSAGEF